MTEPAKAPLVLLCLDSARKQVSTVYQFQSIETGKVSQHVGKGGPEHPDKIDGFMWVEYDESVRT